ncbi:hypothetical protein CXU22_10235 [Akkermansia muciniphila]|uniref:Uncharacterized protein n=1 Tax=Akkermansia muciniphila TaxID=239935 RepID=A0A2N8HAX7_9BACT|nr:hypothetical protein CXU22_10235 [Akkermansia muciniphila]
MHLYPFPGNCNFSKKGGLLSYLAVSSGPGVPSNGYRENGRNPVFPARQGGTWRVAVSHPLPGFEMAENGTFIDPGEMLRTKLEGRGASF